MEAGEGHVRYGSVRTVGLAKIPQFPDHLARPIFYLVELMIFLFFTLFASGALLRTESVTGGRPYTTNT